MRGKIDTATSILPHFYQNGSAWLMNQEFTKKLNRPPTPAMNMTYNFVTLGVTLLRGVC